MREEGYIVPDAKGALPAPDLPEAVTALPFEKALAELEGIVGQLEKGSVPLEESIAIYERGEALKAHCEALLRRAEMRIEKITLNAEGRPTGLVPLDVEETPPAAQRTR